jgi:S1-C subfamily serine protease
MIRPFSVATSPASWTIAATRSAIPINPKPKAAAQQPCVGPGDEPRDKLMAEHFLSKIRVASEDFVETGGKPVLERHQELRALLAERAGPEVASLFAEPLISRGNDAAPPTVSWYSDFEGEARPLADLPQYERDRVETWLAEHLRPLRALVDDPNSTDLALGALSVFGREDVLVQGGRPVIVNWGLLPGGKGANAAARPGHYNETMGKYLPLSASMTGPAAAKVTTNTTAKAKAAAAMPTAPPSAATVVPTGIADVQPAVRSRLSPIAWVPLLVLLLIAGGVLAWLLMPGTRLFHAATPPPVVTDADTLRAARALNQSLRDRQVTLEAALDGAVCRADGVLLLPDGRTPEGLLPPALGIQPDQKAKAAPDALLPSTPARVEVPGQDGTTTLLALIEARTVLILAAKPGGVTTGSGFVVGPGLIVTNHHVIKASMDEPGQIFVTGGGLAQPSVARVVKTLGPLTQTGGDFALLQIDDTTLPAFSVHVPQGSLKLTNVIAAGFPGDVLALDTGFEALKSGDMGAVPSLTVTDGTINTEQNIGPRTRVLMHSAPLSGGNSGGPLVDMCGRVVGVNTFVRQGPMQNRGFALSAADLLDFLDDTAAAPTVISGPCDPIIVRAQVAADIAPKPDQPAKD